MCVTATAGRRAASVVLSTVALALTSCRAPGVAARVSGPAGVRRHGGESLLGVHAHHGIPILQRSFAWDGNGEVEDSGVGMLAGHFLADDLAIGAKLGATSWWTGGRDVYSADTEGLLRFYPWRKGPIFFDGTGGFQLANDQIPPGGTMWNFTFGFGGGVDLPVGEGTSMLLGATYHHISNALGRDNDRNPSQNEARVWIGFGWTF